MAEKSNDDGTTTLLYSRTRVHDGSGRVQEHRLRWHRGHDHQGTKPSTTPTLWGATRKTSTTRWETWRLIFRILSRKRIQIQDSSREVRLASRCPERESDSEIRLSFKSKGRAQRLFRAEGHEGGVLREEPNSDPSPKSSVEAETHCGVHPERPRHETSRGWTFRGRKLSITIPKRGLTPWKCSARDSQLAGIRMVIRGRIETTIHEEIPAVSPFIGSLRPCRAASGGCRNVHDNEPFTVAEKSNTSTARDPALQPDPSPRWSGRVQEHRLRWHRRHNHRGRNRLTTSPTPWGATRKMPTTR